MAKKALIIMNPIAGQKKSNKVLTDIIKIISDKEYICTVVMTRQDLGADKLFKQHAKGKELVVCIGGDGTFNEMVSGMLDTDYRPLIGYIPSGSTNDFAGGMKLSLNPVKAAQDIVNGKVISLDVGTFNDRIFTYVASFGIFTKTSYATPRDLKNSLGYLAYVLEGAKELTDVQHFNVKIETDSKTVQGNYIFGAICNSKQIGGGVLKFSDYAVDVCDGRFELLLIKNPETPSELFNVLRSLQSANYESDMFEFFSAKKITITTEDEIDWTIDGEYQKGENTVKINNLQGAVSFIVKED